MVRYAFGALGMRRVSLTHSRGNQASRRIAERLGFTLEGVQRSANMLPGGTCADRYCYARFGIDGLPQLEVSWGTLRRFNSRQPGRDDAFRTTAF
jgi:hypothetical protein